MWIIRNPFIFGPLAKGGWERPLRETLRNDGDRDDKSKYQENIPSHRAIVEKNEHFVSGKYF